MPVDAFLRFDREHGTEATFGRRLSYAVFNRVAENLDAVLAIKFVLSAPPSPSHSLSLSLSVWGVFLLVFACLCAAGIATFFFNQPCKYHCFE